MRLGVGLAMATMATAVWLSPVNSSATCGQGVCFDYSPGDDGNGVDIGGITTPEEPAQPGSDPDADAGGGTGGGDGTPAEPTPAAPGPGDLCWDNLSPLACPNPAVPTPTPEQPAYPETVYNTDLIHFTPHEPTATAPNEAMALAGTPLPITLTATTHTLTGTLLGHVVSVTFTLDHGDNTAPTQSTDNPATITHNYTTRGTYLTAITTHYSATVTFPDNTPRPVQGTITTTTPGPTAHILTAHTAPVRTTCNTAPNAPGC